MRAQARKRAWRPFPSQPRNTHRLFHGSLAFRPEAVAWSDHHLGLLISLLLHPPLRNDCVGWYVHGVGTVSCTVSLRNSALLFLFAPCLLTFLLLQEPRQKNCTPVMVARSVYPKPTCRNTCPWRPTAACKRNPCQTSSPQLTAKAATSDSAHQLLPAHRC